MKSKCAPQIYKQLTAEQKKLWNKLYRKFLSAESFHIGIQCKFFKKVREVTAHNMACIAVWEMETK